MYATSRRSEREVPLVTLATHLAPLFPSGQGSTWRLMFPTGDTAAENSTPMIRLPRVSCQCLDSWGRSTRRDESGGRHPSRLKGGYSSRSRSR